MAQTIPLIDNLISTFGQDKLHSSEKRSKKRTDRASDSEEKFAKLQEIDHQIAERALLWKYDTNIIPVQTEHLVFGYIRNLDLSYHVTYDLILECIRFYNIGSLRSLQQLCDNISNIIPNVDFEDTAKEKESVLFFRDESWKVMIKYTNRLNTVWYPIKFRRDRGELSTKPDDEKNDYLYQFCMDTIQNAFIKHQQKERKKRDKELLIDFMVKTLFKDKLNAKEKKLAQQIVRLILQAKVEKENDQMDDEI
eukprot:494360_1